MSWNQSILVVFCQLLSIQFFAQAIISGTITDPFGEPLVGATVFVKDSYIGTTAGFDGSYSMEVVEQPDVLVFRFLGYEQQEITVDGRTEIDVILEISNSFLNQIVVTGMAIGTPTAKTGFSISKINEDRFKEVPAVNVATALQSKVPGVLVSSSQGVPGSEPSIRIRGSNNLFSYHSSPLIIVDGIQLQEPASLSDINTEDIQTMEVIKGAAATSLYGSRAGNGVINIITKRGAGEDGKTEITFRNEFGTSSLARKLKRNMHHHYLVRPDGTVDYDQIDPDHFADNDYPEVFDHQELFFNAGSYMTNSLSFASATQKNNYFVSLNNTNQSGIVSFLDGYQRQSLRANIDHKITKSLKLSLSNYYAQSKSDETATQTFNVVDPFFSIQLLPVGVDLNQPNEEDGSPYNWDAAMETNTNVANPLYELANHEISQNIERFSSSLGLHLTIIPSLTLEGNYTIDRRTNLTEEFIDKGFLPRPFYADGFYIRNNRKRTYQTANSKLTLKKKINDLKLVSQAAIIYEDDESNFFGVTAYDFRFEGIRSLDNSSNANLGGSSVNRTERTSEDFEISSLNYFLTSQLDWKDKLIIDGLIRWDGSSLFGANNRWNLFYRGSLAYRLGEDIRIPNVQELKLRASYGTAGNRPGFDYRFETLDSDGTKNRLGNEDLKSSHKREIEVGLDARIWDRLNLNITYAKAYASDLFFDVPLLAGAGGFKSQWQNIDSELESTAYELGVGLDLVQGEDLTFSADLTFTRIEQFLNKFDFSDIIEGPYLTRAGLPFSSFYIVKFAQSLDDLYPHQKENTEYVVNHEGWVVEADKLGTLEERPVLVEEEDGNRFFIDGDSNHDFDLSLGLNLRWKGFQAYGLFHWKQGAMAYNVTRQFPYRDLVSADIDQSIREEQFKKPVEYYSAFYTVFSDSNYFLENSSYLKLRELSLAYHFDTVSWGKLGNVLKGLKLSLVGRNLFTFTPYTGYDPEVAWFDTEFDANSNNTDAFTYPNFRTVSAALEIKF